jgi:hypothetical protein
LFHKDHNYLRAPRTKVIRTENIMSGSNNNNNTQRLLI